MDFTELVALFKKDGLHLADVEVFWVSREQNRVCEGNIQTRARTERKQIRTHPFLCVVFGLAWS